MSITVSSMLEVANFADFQVIAGQKGVYRNVTSVSVMDAPDIYNWIKGGEFLITTGYCMKDDPVAMEDLVRKIEKAGAAALGIKLKRFIDTLPDNVLNAAEELSFPIIYIPIKYAFTDVINPVLSNIVNEQAKKLQHSENIHRAFTQLVINGGNTNQIVDTLKDFLKKDIAFYDLYNEHIYLGAVSQKFINDIETLSIDEILLIYNSYSVDIDKRNYGYIIISDEIVEGHMKDYDEIAIDHANTVLKLDIQKKISNMQIEARYRDEFVRDLIINNIKSFEEVGNRASLYGWSFKKGLLSMIVDIDNFKIQYLKMKQKEYIDTLESIKVKIFEMAKKIMKQYFTQVVYTTFSDSIAFLVEPLSEDKTEFNRILRNICEEIRKEILSKNSFTVTIGIGNYEPLVMDVYKSYENAQKAVKLGRIIYKGNKIIFFEELGVYKLLAPLHQSKDAKEFIESNLKRLIDYDKRNSADLLNTLCYIIKNDWNLKAASKDMYLHYNTIKYRFNKIVEVLNINPEDFEQKLNLAVSIKLMQIDE